MTPQNSTVDEVATLDDEIQRLEAELDLARRRRREATASQPSTSPASIPASLSTDHTAAANHFLLLLSDSALPIGSFAFSSGLESFLAHRTPSPPTTSASFSAFLPLSIASVASAALPYVLAAHRRPASVVRLDDALDAATVCTVARRASTSQGRALLSIWQRSFRPSDPDTDPLAAYAALLLRHLRRDDKMEPPPLVSGHYPPLFGAVCRLLGLDRRRTAYVFLLGHVKAVVSAAVRAGAVGPYHAQRMLAGDEVRALLAAAVEREWSTPVGDAGQSVPIMDLWVGRHEVLYSRIFNS